jgi:hypothetical protein
MRLNKPQTQKEKAVRPDKGERLEFSFAAQRRLAGRVITEINRNEHGSND